jgi:protease-4
MSLGVLFFISITLSLISLSFILQGAGKPSKPLPQNFVLIDEFKGQRADVNTTHPLIFQLIPQPMSLYGFLKTLNQAKDDDRVTHFVALIRDGDYSLDQIQTLRRAIIDFRATGKTAIAYADNFGGFSNGIGEYWLATAFDEIWLSPLGLLSINGIRIEQPFFKEALGKVGINMQAEQRKEYKTGPEMYLRQTMSNENRKTTQAIINDIMDVILTDIETARGISRSTIDSFIDQAPLLSEGALEGGFIDYVAPLDDLEKTLKGDEENEAKEIFVGMSRYAWDVRQPIKKDSPIVTIVDLSGMIVDMDLMARANHPFALSAPEEFADAPLIASAINAVAKDESRDVIILRVSSPGGTPEASEIIRIAVQNAQEKGKYVIVSMADIAASGGYWVSVNADEIIADDLTLTGSIGVYGGKPDLSGLWNMIGVNWQAMQYGGNAGIWSTNKPFDTSERARFDAMMDFTYDMFRARVAEGRDMTIEDVEAVAKGRAWTGRDALDAGLIDRLGGFDTALDAASKKLGLDHWTQARVIVTPIDDDPFDDLVKMLGLPSLSSTAKLPAFISRTIIPEAIVTAPFKQIDF